VHVLYYFNAKLLLGVLVLFLTGCSTTPQTLQLKQYPPKHLKQKVELDDVGFFPQHDFQCGPAALATALSYQNIKIKPDDLVNKVYIPNLQGSLQIEMISAARSYGVLTYKIKPQLHALLDELNHGNPVLVFQNLSLQLWPQWHYAVAIGYDLNKAELILRSGTELRHTISFSTFEQTWQRGEYWAYTLLQAGKIPSTADPLDYIKTSHELHISGFSENALKAYQQGAKKWPDNPLVLIALGNAEFTNGNFNNSIDAFLQALKYDQTSITAWNNLAYALIEKKCKTQALKVISCGISLMPDNKNILHSMIEIQNTSVLELESCINITCPEK